MPRPRAGYRPRTSSRTWTGWCPGPPDQAEPRQRGLAFRDRGLVQGQDHREEPGGIGDVRGVPAVLVSSDDPDDRSLAGLRVDIGEERPAAGPVGEVVAIEDHFARAEVVRLRRAGDRFIRL